MKSINEACGVFGVFKNGEPFSAAGIVYYGLYALQHRGQESCGIAVNDGGKFRSHKDTGLVSDVFSPETLSTLGSGNIAVGHVRYGTTGSSDRVNAQPIVVKHTKGGMALAHNGNLVNASELREELELRGSIFHTTADSEIIAHIITQEFLSAPSVEEALSRTMNRLHGAYSLVIMTEKKLIAARDENGFRPLCYGKTKDGVYIVASESCALGASGAKFIRDIKPGEILVLDGDGEHSITTHCDKVPESLCIFEFIYFARPDSVIAGSPVHNARLRAGAYLAIEYPVQADIIIGAPDSGIDAAIGFARQSGIPYGIGLIKNKYIGRTFITPEKESRKNKVSIKLNPVSATVSGKRVVLVDDSIVRGTTSAHIVKMLRKAGATEVHLRISAPPFLNPCYYGTDIDSRENLIAYNHSMPEIAEILGVDSIGYLSVENAKKIAENHRNCGFCTACFSGEYPTELPGEANRNRFES